MEEDMTGSGIGWAGQRQCATQERKRESERESMDRTTGHGNKIANSAAEEDSRRLDPNLTITRPTLRWIS